jgi:hypothetical protein
MIDEPSGEPSVGRGDDPGADSRAGLGEEPRLDAVNEPSGAVVRDKAFMRAPW